MARREIDWDKAYNNAGHVPEALEMQATWAAQSAEYRAGVKITEDIPYGDAPRERLDIIWPDGTPRGLAVYIHGGYWLRNDKSVFTLLAEGARARGWAMAMPSYTLAPEVRISHITRQVARAIAVAAGEVAGPIRISGHSAGGHLAARMACDDVDLPAPVADRIEHVFPISGLHDLRPLMKTWMNADLHLDMEEATRESPALLRPGTDARVTAWVGGGELPELVRQSRLLPMIWAGFGLDITEHVDGTHNHFTVIEPLRDPGSEICEAFLG